MAEKRKRRRYDLRPQNRPDVKAGVKKAHLDMQGRLISGTLATGQKARRNQQGDVVLEEEKTKSDEGYEITPKDMSLRGFYERNPDLTTGKFDPKAATGLPSVKRRLKAKMEERARIDAKNVADEAAQQKTPGAGGVMIGGGDTGVLGAGLASGDPAPAPGKGKKGLDVGKIEGAEGLKKPEDPPKEEEKQPPEPTPGTDAETDPNRAGGGGGGDPVAGAQPGLNNLTAGEGPSRQGARVREGQAASAPTPAPASRIEKSQQEIDVARAALEAVQIKDQELNRMMEEQKRRQSGMSRRRKTINKGPQMTPQ